MSATVKDMPKKPKDEKPQRYPSRENTKYAGIPRDYWDMLEAMTADGEKYEGRSVSFLVKIGVRLLLQQEGKMDAKGKPIDSAE